MYTILDLDNWNRKDHFHFFGQFEEPFFSVTANVDCTAAYNRAKQMGISFYLYYLYQCLRAANQVENFKYRIVDGDVRIYDRVDVSATSNRKDGTFGFAYINFDNDLDTFIENAKAEISRVEITPGLIPAVSGENVIHCSALPWINFTSLSHARSFTFKDSCPKVSFGKVTETGGSRSMPVSVTVHHGLMDGLHVGQYFDAFQDCLNS